MLSAFRKLPEAKQRAILSAAAKVFALKGFHQANVADICQKAGISNGALYKYFENKQALFVGVFDYAVQIMVAELFQKNLDRNDSVYETVHHIFEDLAALAEEQPELLMLYVNIGSCSMNDMAPPLSGKVEGEAKRFWLELVRRGKANGEINKELADAAVAYFMDNHLSLLAYSLVSKHFETRFMVYFGDDVSAMSAEAAIEIIMQSIRMMLE